MPKDRTLISLADLVHRACAIVDPKGADPAVAEFAERHQDDDQPVRGILDVIEERLRWGADEVPAVIVAQALTLYLAHRLDEFDGDPETLLVLATRDEFDGQPPEDVAAWLSERGVSVA